MLCAFLYCKLDIFCLLVSNVFSGISLFLFQDSSYSLFRAADIGLVSDTEMYAHRYIYLEIKSFILYIPGMADD